MKPAIAIILSLIGLAIALALFHHRPASSDYTDPIGHYSDQGQAWMSIQSQMIDGDFIRPFHQTRTTQSMGQVFADPDTGLPLPGYLLFRPGPLSDMAHRAIGAFQRKDIGGVSYVLHRYYSLPFGRWSVAGDGNRGADERVTNENHYGRLIYAAIYPRDNE